MSGDSDEHPSWFPVPEEDVSPEPQQREIINSDAYPMRVLAGAGTGKTFTMVRKIEHLIDEEDVSPDRILALTFTNNAADSMREKLNAKLGAAGYDIDAYTYHSICNEILTDYAYEAGIDPDFEVAALFVNVNARIRSGDTSSSSMRDSIFRTIVNVFPVPAPASTRIGYASELIIASCRGSGDTSASGTGTHDGCSLLSPLIVAPPSTTGPHTSPDTHSPDTPPR